MPQTTLYLSLNLHNIMALAGDTIPTIFPIKGSIKLGCVCTYLFNTAV